MLNLELCLKLPKDNPEVRGRNGNNTIKLFLPNIYRDCGDSFEDFIHGLIHIYTVEFICISSVEEVWYDYEDAVCKDKDYCPINEILIEHGFQYKMELFPGKYIF